MNLKAEECRRKADECAELARLAADPAPKEKFLELADEWMSREISRSANRDLASIIGPVTFGVRFFGHGEVGVVLGNHPVVFTNVGGGGCLGVLKALGGALSEAPRPALGIGHRSPHRCLIPASEIGRSRDSSRG